jgi:hypothetical protein
MPTGSELECGCAIARSLRAKAGDSWEEILRWERETRCLDAVDSHLMRIWPPDAQNRRRKFGVL